ncbi:hypothetical protein ABC383_20675 [Noviherbaspirillum sp. 1P10PC]|uniref:hypothetical protein n=1 Tax=Noviherbaspirillum sp. 1P10PC TaxID=3132292 RepID=UPI0039A01459
MNATSLAPGNYCRYWLANAFFADVIFKRLLINCDPEQTLPYGSADRDKNAVFTASHNHEQAFIHHMNERKGLDHEFTKQRISR